MTGADFERIRLATGLTLYAWGRALGYQGERQSVKTQIAEMQKDIRPITLHVERLAQMYERHGVPEEFK